MNNTHSISTLSDKLVPFLQNVQGILINEEARRHIMDVAAHLPAALACSLFGFELRLNDAPAVDMAFSTIPDLPPHPVLSGLIPELPLSATMLKTREWQRICSFAASWGKQDSTLRGILDILCLEFDLPAPAPEKAVPLVFFGVESQGQEFRRRSGLKDVIVLEECASRFFGVPIREEVVACLHRCHNTAKNYGGGVFQIGLMLSRPGDSIRICVHNVDKKHVYQFVRDIGWPGNLEDLNQALAGPCAAFDRLALAFDCAAVLPGGLSPKLGLESYFKNKAQPDKEPRWESALQTLVDDGICLPGKAEALLRFPAVTRLLPFSDPALKALPGYVVPKAAARGLHHIKIVLEPEGGLSAKAYLWCGYVQ